MFYANRSMVLHTADSKLLQLNLAARAYPHCIVDTYMPQNGEDEEMPMVSICEMQ